MSAASQWATAADVATPESGTYPRSPLVLIVDDHADTRDLYEECLRAAGFRTEQAEDGRAGVAKALALSPNLVLMDHEMPDMDGAEAARCLKADARTSRILVILVTAGPEPCDGERDWDAYVRKPCVPDEVVGAVQARLRLAPRC